MKIKHMNIARTIRQNSVGTCFHENLTQKNFYMKIFTMKISMYTVSCDR